MTPTYNSFSELPLDLQIQHLNEGRIPYDDIEIPVANVTRSLRNRGWLDLAKRIEFFFTCEAIAVSEIRREIGDVPGATQLLKLIVEDFTPAP